MKAFRVERQVLQHDTGTYAKVSMYIDAISGADAGFAADCNKYGQDQSNAAAFRKAHKACHRVRSCPDKLCVKGEPSYYNPEMP